MIVLLKLTAFYLLFKDFNSYLLQNQFGKIKFFIV